MYFSSIPDEASAKSGRNANSYFFCASLLDSPAPGSGSTSLKVYETLGGRKASLAVILDGPKRHKKGQTTMNGAALARSYLHGGQQNSEHNCLKLSSSILSASFIAPQSATINYFSNRESETKHESVESVRRAAKAALVTKNQNKSSSHIAYRL